MYLISRSYQPHTVKIRSCNPFISDRWTNSVQFLVSSTNLRTAFSFIKVSMYLWCFNITLVMQVHEKLINFAYCGSCFIRKKMDSLSHQQLMNKQGQGYTAESVLANVDVICYYFSAHWCPPCRMFTPILADFYRVSYDYWSMCKLHKIMSHAL